MNKANEPAYPVPLGAEEGLPSGLNPNGLTKREYFAALAMQGMLSNSKTSEFTPAKGCHYAFLSKLAVNYADALLAELEKQ